VLPQHSQQLRRQATSRGLHATCFRILAWCSLSNAAIVKSMSGRKWQHKTPYIGDDGFGSFGGAVMWGDDCRTSNSRSWAISDCTMLSSLRGGEPTIAALGASRHRQALLTYRLCWTMGRFSKHIVSQLYYTQMYDHVSACLHFNGAIELRCCIMVERYIANSRSESGSPLPIAATSRRARRSETKRQSDDIASFIQ
jgi:hypothetical protein